mmetsp:Transcript_20009/g.53093  ORF Transcript_20009/g.53093 Transcript_20009/m.53093 type:complete len:222 (+) Transcript_20009:738-1403(+)
MQTDIWGRRKITTGQGGCARFKSLDLRIATILRRRHGRLRGVDAAQRRAEELRGVGGHLLQERLHRIRHPLLDVVLRHVVADLGVNERYPRLPLLLRGVVDLSLHAAHRQGACGGSWKSAVTRRSSCVKWNSATSEVITSGRLPMKENRSAMNASARIGGSATSEIITRGRLRMKWWKGSSAVPWRKWSSTTQAGGVSGEGMQDSNGSVGETSTRMAANFR